VPAGTEIRENPASPVAQRFTRGSEKRDVAILVRRCSSNAWNNHTFKPGPLDEVRQQLTERIIGVARTAGDLTRFGRIERGGDKFRNLGAAKSASAIDAGSIESLDGQSPNVWKLKLHAVYRVGGVGHGTAAPIVVTGRR
jgi:hypothetical protein